MKGTVGHVYYELRVLGRNRALQCFIPKDCCVLADGITVDAICLPFCCILGLNTSGSGAKAVMPKLMVITSSKVLCYRDMLTVAAVSPLYRTNPMKYWQHIQPGATDSYDGARKSSRPDCHSQLSVISYLAVRFYDSTQQPNQERRRLVGERMWRTCLHISPSRTGGRRLQVNSRDLRLRSASAALYCPLVTSAFRAECALPRRGLGLGYLTIESFADYPCGALACSVWWCLYSAFK